MESKRKQIHDIFGQIGEIIDKLQFCIKEIIKIGNFGSISKEVL